MKIVNTKRLTHVGLAVLAASALQLPLLAQAAPTPQAAAPSGFIVQASTEAKIMDETRPIKSMLRKLELTEEQKAQINPLIKQKKPQFTQLHEAMRANRLASYQLMFASNFDAKKAKELAEEQGKLVSEITLSRSQLMSEVYQKLTPEQQEKLRTFHESKENKAPRKHPKST